MSAEQNKSIVYRWVEAAWNHGDFSTASQLYPPSYALNDTSAPAPFKGAEGLVGFIKAYRAAFPDLQMTIEQMVAEGDMVAWRFRVRGTQLGELQGIPPSGRAIDIMGSVFSRFENGRWVEDYSNADLLTMLRQIGIIPSQQPVQ